MKQDNAGISGRFTIIAISLSLAIGIFISLMLLGTVSAKSGSDATSQLAFSTIMAKLTGNQILENPNTRRWQAKVTSSVTGAAIVKVPLLTEITVAVTGASVASVPVTVLDTPLGELGAYQFKVSYDPAVIQATSVLGGDSPFAGITASNVTNPVTGAEVVEWNHFQSGSVFVPASIDVANIVFTAVGTAGECSTLSLTIVELVDNSAVSIPSVSEDGQVCLLEAFANVETSLIGTQDGDDAALPTGVKATIDQIKDAGSGDPLPGRLIGSYKAELTFPATLAEATDCRLKSPVDQSPTNCSISAGLVQLQATAGVTGSGVTAPIDPLAFVALRLIGANNSFTTVNLNFTEIKDDLGNLMPQISPPDTRTFLRGDALADGGISIGDALFIGQHLVAARPVGEGPGEVNPVNAGSVKHDSPNDFISLADAILIAQFLVGNVDELFQ